MRPLSNLGNCGHIHDIEPGIADHLAKDDFCVRLDCRLYGREIVRRDEGGGDAKARQGIFQQVDIRTIHARGRNDMVAG